MRTVRSSFSVACALVAVWSLATPAGVAAQGAIDVFHSTQSANLPTATTIPKGWGLFEISHRFLPSFSQGADALWGLDGPVYNRLGLAYAPTERLMIGVQRSNFNDNLEFNAKAWLVEGRSGEIRYKLAAMGGYAVNFGATPVGGVKDNESQYYGQGILDASVADRFAVGVVPTLIRNPRIEDVDPVSAFVLGLHGQYRATRSLSLIGEWILSGKSGIYPHDGVSFGIEIETLGHFFKLLATNQVRMNPTQYLAGTAFGYGKNDWHFGFNITRALRF